MRQQTEGPETRFQDLDLSQQTLDVLKQIGYHTPSPIQAAFLPIALTGRDCIGQAHTGTGKTAAYLIPILERIEFGTRKPQALVLTPTRELSEQVYFEARSLSGTRPCRTVCMVGGRPIGRQLDGLRAGVEIAVGTPGRVMDLMRRRALDLSELRVVVLDESDRMLDIGFRPDIETILRQCPRKRQTLLLSATVPAPVQRLARRYMDDPLVVDLSSDGIAVDSITQYYVTVDSDRKFGLLCRLLSRERPQQALVFTRTKRGADALHARLAGRLPQVELLHGDLPQSRRDRVMRSFRKGQVRLLIATDVAGRGIDVTGISHIVNYDIPECCDDYVHRIGRTGRMTSAGKGNAITFVTRDQGDKLTSIEMRVNRMLDEYRVDSYEAYRPVPPRPVLESTARVG